jgi:hypothetical protein
MQTPTSVGVAASDRIPGLAGVHARRRFPERKGVEGSASKENGSWDEVDARFLQGIFQKEEIPHKNSREDGSFRGWKLLGLADQGGQVGKDRMMELRTGFLKP